MALALGTLIAAAWLACRGDAPVVLAKADAISVADPSRVRFAALGDAGKANATQGQVAKSLVDHCARRGCDFVLLLGDLVYPRGVTSPTDPEAARRILDPYADVQVPLLAVLGNHDYAHGGDRQRAGWLLEWAQGQPQVVLPGQAWTTTAGPVHLVALDTADAIRFGASPQLGWLTSTLADIPSVDRFGKRTWIVAFGHHPRWSDGPHGNAGRYEGWSGVPWMSGASVRTLLAPLESRAQLYFAGHDHSRQFIDHAAMVQVVSGAGASATKIVDRGNAPPFARATPGFTWIELGPDSGTIEFLDASGVVEWTGTIPR